MQSTSANDAMPTRPFVANYSLADKIRGIGEAMTPRVVMEHVFAEPFQPFRIHPASGRTFEVRHPEFVKIGRNTLTIYAPPESDPDGPQRWEEIALVLIESIAPLSASVSAGS
jgi:hypothetical protein